MELEEHTREEAGPLSPAGEGAAPVAMTKGGEAASKVYPHIDRSRERDADGRPDTATEPDVEVRELSYSYPAGKEVLHQVNLSIARGSRTGLVGPNGAGKSTLLLHLNGILVGGGSVSVTGMEVTKRNLRKVRATVGMVFQDPDDQLFSPTVFEDVAYGLLHMGLDDEEVRRRVGRALSDVAMSDYEQEMPHRLSLGERKRVAIATVLAMEPRILILDEPTAGLDPRTRRNLIRLLLDLPQTMLIASHDMRLVRDVCTDVVVLDRGSVISQGEADTILYDRELMEAHGLELP